MFVYYFQSSIIDIITYLTGGNRGSLVSMGKPTSSTLASLAGLFKERDERSVSQAPDAQSGTDERLGDTNEGSEKENIISRARVCLFLFYVTICL